MKKEIVGALLVSTMTSVALVGCSSSDDTPKQVVTLGEAPVNTPSVAIQLKDNNGIPLSGVKVDITSEDDSLAKPVIVHRKSTVSSYASKKESEATSDDVGNIIIALTESAQNGQVLVLTVDPVKNPTYHPYTKRIVIGSDTKIEELSLQKRATSDKPESIKGVDAEGNEVANVVTMVEGLKPKENASINDIPVADGTGTVTVTGTVAEIKTPTTSGATEEVVAQVVIPTGVQATTADGQPSSGEIKVSAAIYQATAPESVAVFPGGLELPAGGLEDDLGANVAAGETIPDVITPETAGLNSEGFQTAGFVAIEVKDKDGKSITNFGDKNSADNGTGGKGLVITTLIPQSTLKPDGDGSQKVAIGDKIPVWSYNNKTGKWQYDGEAKIYADAGDGKNYKAHFSATHLSYWNIDYRIRYCRSKLSVSDVLKVENLDKAMIEFKNKATGERDKRTLTVKMARKGGGFFLKKDVLGDGFVQSFRVPNLPVKLSILDEAGKEVKIVGVNDGTYDSDKGLNLCDNVAQGNDIYLEQPAVEPERNDVNLKVVTSCKDNTLDTLLPPKPVPGAFVYFYQGGALRFVKQSDDLGDAEVTNLLSDNNYTLRVFANLGGTYGFETVSLKPARSAANPVIVDFEQKCKVTTTTGSGGGN